MYPEHYKAFSQNITFAARILHYYLHMGGMAKYPSAEYNALNHNARFWNDFNYMALQTVVIFLGKIFDNDSKGFKVHSVFKTINAAFRDITHFNKDALRSRKIALAGEFVGLDEYVAEAHALSKDDLKAIKIRLKRAREIWEKIEPLRNKIYAHNEILTEDELLALFQKVTYDDLEELVQILLNVSHALEQAEINGRKPNFNDDYEGPINRAEGEMDRLLNVLVKGTTSES